MYHYYYGRDYSRPTYRSNALERGLIYIGEDVGFRVAEDLEGDGAVVVFQWRNVVITYRQFGPSVDLIASNGQRTKRHRHTNSYKYKTSIITAAF